MKLHFKWADEQNPNGAANVIVSAMQAVNDHDLAVLQNKLGLRVFGCDMASVGIKQKPLTGLLDRKKPSYLALPMPEPVAMYSPSGFADGWETTNAAKEEGEKDFADRCVFYAG